MSKIKKNMEDIRLHKVCVLLSKAKSQAKYYDQEYQEKLEKEADRIVEPQYADCAGSNISWNEYILPPEEGERIEEEVEEKLSNYLAKFTAEDFRELIFDEFNI